MSEFNKNIKIEENLSPSNIQGMGAPVLPNQGEIGSGDIPTGRKEDEDEEEKNKNILGFDDFFNRKSKYINKKQSK